MNTETLSAPASPTPIEAGTILDDPGWIGLIEEIVGAPAAMDERCRRSDLSTTLLPRMLGLSLGVFAAWSGVQAVASSLAGVPFVSRHLLAFPLGAAGDVVFSAGVLFLAYTGGIIGALCASLPSFSVAAMLAGLQVPVRRLAVEYVRALAASVIYLLGLVPVYAFLVLAALRLDPEIAEQLIYVGYALPFLVGFLGRRSLQNSFGALVREAGGTDRQRGTWLVATITALLTVLSFSGTIQILVGLEGLL